MIFKKNHVGEIFILKFIKFLYKNSPLSHIEKSSDQEQQNILIRKKWKKWGRFFLRTVPIPYLMTIQEKLDVLKLNKSEKLKIQEAGSWRFGSSC